MEVRIKGSRKRKTYQARSFDLEDVMSEPDKIKSFIGDLGFLITLEEDDILYGVRIDLIDGRIIGPGQILVKIRNKILSFDPHTFRELYETC